MAVASRFAVGTVASVENGSDVFARASAWADAHPDPEARLALRPLIESGDEDALRELFDTSLSFGTAGIRGPVGHGPNRMNRSVVIRTTRGLADHLIAKHGERPERAVIVGYDARETSRQFAEDTIGVLAAAGIPVLHFADATPTPLVAFAAKHLHALSAVVITASHNPPSDNGYKVYAENAAQIIPPDDASISRAIELAGSVDRIPRVEDALEVDHPLISLTPPNCIDCYWDEVDAARPDPQSSDLTIIYTPLHGVGGAVLEEVFSRAGHAGLVSVVEQAIPDGAFPTVDFPNPEEDGALDLALAAARRTDADLILANDPDADRLAVVVGAGGGEWRALTGNEIGTLLGDYVLRHYSGASRPIVVNSIVSSPALGRVAALYDARHEVTLTGFKWIVNAGVALEESGEGRFVFGYEEALGYTVGSTVRDKDGIATALGIAVPLHGGESARAAGFVGNEEL